METITKYQAFDGSEFLDSDSCLEHESNCKEIDMIMDRLPAEPCDDGCQFSNGAGYIQHEKMAVLKIRNEFLEFVKRYTTASHIQQSIDMGFDAHPSWAGRMIDDCAPRYISKRWYRFMCMDDKFREWGQPYYANNPGKAEQKQLN